MENIVEFVRNFFLELDTHLEGFVGDYGFWVYGLLFLIIFAETGFVITPFLPGDSLLFATGALAASGILDIYLAIPLLLVAAIAGDAVNYAVGHFVGPRVFRAEDRANIWHRLLNRKHLMEAHAFFERHGGKAIVLGRFVPIVRTFVTLVAGVGRMDFRKFILYTAIGGVLWVCLVTTAGYYLGNVGFIRNNIDAVLVLIVLVSVIPMGIEYLLHRRRARTESRATA